MHFVTLLSIAIAATLATTLPHDSFSIEKRTYCSNTSSAPWQIYLFTMFTANVCCSGEGSTLSFNFTDPNFYNNANNGLTTGCYWSGAAATQPNTSNFYPCDDCTVQWKFDGFSHYIEQDVDCGGTTKTASGHDALDLTLYIVDGGTQISDNDQTTYVPIGSVA
ncbi:hypothetical protein OEA41_009286 [Lepraria neglecta]|uniref:Uncharacterized protein n=1 Tax=Lepraria neglecta TaxID=209136 RepID=A0AAE0DGQ7_9LECA|nr:hypothetical protein OEA41_009286 [Lepraria neglecta]